jgi:hypothetical protein
MNQGFPKSLVDTFYQPRATSVGRSIFRARVPSLLGRSQPNAQELAEHDAHLSVLHAVRSSASLLPGEGEPEKSYGYR